VARRFDQLRGSSRRVCTCTPTPATVFNTTYHYNVYLVYKANPFHNNNILLDIEGTSDRCQHRRRP
jgi:hypothetical protein